MSVSGFENLEQEINELTLRVDKLAEEGKYEEADNVQKKLEVLKKKHADAKKRDLLKEHENREAQLREAFRQTEKKFSVEWDEEMKKFEIESHQALDDIKKRHEVELQALEDALEREPKEPFRPSSELTSLRTTEKQLAKLKKFQEAQRAKLAADQLEQAEKLRFSKEEEARRDALRNELKAQHQKEIAAHEKKVERGRKEKSLQRETDSARLEQRFRNLLRDQRNEQRAQTNHFDRELNAIRGKEAGIAISSPFKNSAPSSPSLYNRTTTENNKRLQTPGTSRSYTLTPIAPLTGSGTKDPKGK